MDLVHFEYLIFFYFFKKDKAKKKKKQTTPKFWPFLLKPTSDSNLLIHLKAKFSA